MSHQRPASIACLLVLACVPTAEITEQPSTTTEQPSSTTEQPNPDEQPQPGPVQLSQLETTITVETGTVLHYSFKSHASVGLGGTFEIGDPTVLEHVRTDIAYEQSAEQRAGKTGADAATETFVFEAKSPGTSALRVTELFRGDPQRELEYTITVVDRR